MQNSLKITFFHIDLVLMKKYLVVWVNEALYLQIGVKTNIYPTVSAGKLMLGGRRNNFCR